MVVVNVKLFPLADTASCAEALHYYSLLDEARVYEVCHTKRYYIYVYNMPTGV